ncbi:ISNCY family transposase [Candidatus Symbiopectobacterium sp. 'North America']|uniref:Rpn family recombination-promoting nuclease/putative transposase n=1 Tax=Candidatus Symbiopectobacterium sp. 'North America' TaxID=2794574 RepID=UPI0018CB0558|nr:Rpn family recombination-promoting nuclease/putative transposase [Candidatus Symbiopectobacterium sp. 'North America']MBG6244676.1 ISNCY family transposase [Candidatus Symbiopectobacterium sp. 'North America']
MKKANNKVTCPHDATFKQFLTYPESARDFIQLHLPEKLLALCDLTTLKLESGSFVEDDLRAYYSDVLYSLQTRAGAGYVHVLIEHQSKPDKQMAFRLMRYAIAAMQRHLDAGNKQLPLVIPMLFYAGKPSPCPNTTNWLQLFDNPALAQQLYSEDFPLVDVTIIPDDEIMRHRSIAALTLIQKHIRQRDLSELTDMLVTIFLTTNMTRQQVRSLINYMVQAGNAIDAQAYLRQLAQRVPQHGDELMTIAEQLEQKGIEKGIEKGVEKGQREATLKIASELLHNGVELAIVIKSTGLSKEALMKLKLSH